MTPQRQAAKVILDDMISIVKESLLDRLEAVIASQGIEVTQRAAATSKRAVERPDGVEEGVWRDWLAIRSKKGLPLTPTAWTKLSNEIKLSGMTVQEALEVCCQNGWAGFKASWIDRDKPVAGFAGDI